MKKRSNPKAPVIEINCGNTFNIGMVLKVALISVYSLFIFAYKMSL